MFAHLWTSSVNLGMLVFIQLHEHDSYTPSLSHTTRWIPTTQLHTTDNRSVHHCSTECIEVNTLLFNYARWINSGWGIYWTIRADNVLRELLQRLRTDQLPLWVYEEQRRRVRFHIIAGFIWWAYHQLTNHYLEHGPIVSIDQNPFASTNYLNCTHNSAVRKYWKSRDQCQVCVYLNVNEKDRDYQTHASGRVMS